MYSFVEVRKVVHESKRTYVPIDDDTESPAMKRHKIYSALQDCLPDSVGVIYWKEEQKTIAQIEPVQVENRHVEIPK